MRKILQRLKFYRQIRFFRYLYLNYFCRGVVRTDQSRIIPYRGAVLDLAPGLQPMAYSTDGILEAVWMPEKPFVWAVQWHPEAFWEQKSMHQELFDRFVAAAK